ncbi:MAG: hypothetical protein PWQ10_121 [Patescibacteria group bacterium]|nr:hypothetical protein [Patescibacteria group bacterium]
MNHVVKKNGFTIVELMLAMTFVATLLVSISMTIIQISNIYNRGLTLKDVNQAGSSIASELERSIKETSSFSLDEGSGHYIIQADQGGRLCLGNYSYLWNYGSKLKSPNTLYNQYSDTIYNRSNPIRFVKVPDTDNSYCIDLAKKVDYTNSTELLGSGQHDLALHNFSISKGASDVKTGQSLYSISYIIGTNDEDSFVDNNIVCLPPTAANSDPSYCYINDFSIIVRSGNMMD